MKNVQLIPLDQIRVLNPRVRNRKKFLEIVDSISKIGLKKPITVSRRGDDGGYDLICGQGRMEACESLGMKEVLALVIETDRENCYIMSLVENMARRAPRSYECAKEIQVLRERGYTQAQVAQKLGMSEPHVSVLERLMKSGEERLLLAVERGDIPINIAAEIAAVESHEIQRCLAEAYETGKLRGAELLRVRKLVEQRQTRGKSLRGPEGPRSGRARGMSPTTIVRTYNKEVQRQAQFVKKARLCETRLTFLHAALGDLFRDEDFVNLLRAEGFDTVPKYLQDRANAGSR